MPKVEFEGEKFEVPEGLSDEQMLELVREERNTRALAKSKKEANAPVSPPEDLVVPPELQLERDRIAAQIRYNEAESVEGVNKRVEELRDLLEVRPMNATVRKMLKRELKLWEMAQEIEK